MDGGFRDLKVYQLAYALSIEIFHVSKGFPREERFSLTDQIRRSARSVAANIAEGYRKRSYPNHFALKMTDADGECAETQVWLDTAKDCGYLHPDQHLTLLQRYEEVGRMLNYLIKHPERFSR
jgi:four helix bundle protein